MPDINKMAPRSGRILKEDGTVINIADAGLPVQLMGSYVEYRGKSTDVKPTPENVVDTFFEIDTTDVYMWDGSGWELI